MKSYNQFVSEAYTIRQELHEKFGLSALGKVGRFIPGLQQIYGLGLGTYRLAKGDKLGAALGYGQALPGPAGWAFLGADVARSMKGTKPAEKKPEEAKVETPEVETPKAETPKTEKPKDTRTAAEIGKGVSDTIQKIQAKYDSGDIKNPFVKKQSTTVPPAKPVVRDEKKKKFDIRDRDIRARAGFDPRYDKR